MRFNKSRMTMVRGDTESIAVKFDGYELKPTDRVNMIALNPYSKKTLFEKNVAVFEDNVAVISIVPADTETAAYGDYIYAITLETPSSVKTLVADTFSLTDLRPACSSDESSIDVRLEMPNNEFTVSVEGSGPSGADGGYYTPSIEQPNETAMRLSYAPSIEGMPAVHPVELTLPSGKDGEPGADGRDGISPSASVVETETGALISVTDSAGTTNAEIRNGKDGERGADGKDGEPGQKGDDGFSPVVDTESISNGTRVTITDLSGPKTFDVLNGQNGVDGKTPEKGVDYYTEEDKQAIVQDVLEATSDQSVTSFNNRTGIVMPQKGDYTAEMVGALPSEVLMLTGFEPDPVNPDSFSMKLQLTDEQYEAVYDAMRTGRPINFEGHYMTFPIGDASDHPVFATGLDDGSGWRLSVDANKKIATARPQVLSTTPDDIGSFDSLDVPKTGADSVKFDYQYNLPLLVIYAGTNWILYPESNTGNIYVFSNGKYRLTADADADTITLSSVMNDIIAALPVYNGEVE